MTAWLLTNANGDGLWLTDTEEKICIELGLPIVPDLARERPLDGEAPPAPAMPTKVSPPPW
jgi:hypothetical protein